MKRLLLPLLVIVSIPMSKGLADDASHNAPVRIEGRISDQDPQIKFKLDPKNPKSVHTMRAKSYDLQLTAGKHYTILLDAAEPGKGLESPKALDPFLIVQDADGKTLAHDDDSGGNFNAKLSLTVPLDGSYRVFAGTIRGTGAFVLTIAEANVVRQGFPAAGADATELTKSDTAWEIEWEITNADNGMGPKRTKPSSVLAIRSAKFMFKDQKGKPHWLTVLKNLEVSEILVAYDHVRPVFMDVAEHPFNIVPAKKEYLGPSCVTPGQILDSADPRMKNRVLKEVHDDGLRWANGSEKTRRGEKMLLWAIFNGANYRYILEYGFHDDGMISCRLGATAHNLLDRQTDGRDVHLHVGCWRWDPELCEAGEPDIGGAAFNRVLLVRRVPRTAAPNGLFRVDIAPFNPDDKGQAMEGFADWKPEEFTALRVESTIRKNGSKSPRHTAYDVIPVRLGAVRNYPWKYAFANHDFWVTQRRGNQLRYGDVPLYAMGCMPLDKTPVTIWHNSASYHVPRAEDYGIDGVSARHGAAITTWAGFLIKPINLFDSTPLYDSNQRVSDSKSGRN
jgi:hypothetical protein